MDRLRTGITVGGWSLPNINILDKIAETVISDSEIEKRKDTIEEALASYGVEAKVIEVNRGPTVTQFGVEPGWDRKFKEIREKDRDGNVSARQEEVGSTRVKVERINSLANDLALALAAPSIRIEAPVPGKSMVGIEVPNTTFGSVSLRGVMETTAFQKMLAKSRLALALGKGAGGETIVADLAKMPHLLIAGATGSGKSVCLNSVICCLMMNNTPDAVRFIMVDPKRVELVNYNSIPHLVSPVVVDTEKAIMALRWLNAEMDGRYKRFSAVKARNIEDYNKNRQPSECMPYIVLVIDELADLMMAAFDEVETFTLPPGAACPRHRHPPDSRHAAALGGRGYRPDQGQLPHAHQLRRSPRRWIRAPSSIPPAPRSCWAGATCSTCRRMPPSPSACRAPWSATPR